MGTVVAGGGFALSVPRLLQQDLPQAIGVVHRHIRPLRHEGRRRVRRVAQEHDALPG